MISLEASSTNERAPTDEQTVSSKLIGNVHFRDGQTAPYIGALDTCAAVRPFWYYGKLYSRAWIELVTSYQTTYIIPILPLNPDFPVRQ